tara:strand:+ start:83331 stop:85352 length:2022 start_codon:yes stop_codon:yes gene_type:complete
MSNAFTNAWGWSIKHSPLLSVWRAARGFVRPNREAFALLEKATLPESIDEVIRSTIVRTKLWRDEREQIARELIAHAQDAIDAGREPDQIVSTFGDPQRVARLMRRSMKRKRPLSWQAYRFSRRAAGGLLLVLFVSYIAVVVRFYTSEPQIKTDFGAILDSRSDGFSEDQKSWAILMDCGVVWSKIEHLLAQEQADRAMLQTVADDEAQDIGVAIFPYIEPDHPDYQAFEEAVRGFAPYLDELRAAAQRPIIGLPVGYEPIMEKWEGRMFVTGVVPAGPDEYKQQSVIGVQLIHLGSLRRLSQVLIYDARLAVEEGDIQRACTNYIAAMGLARQTRNESILYSELVGIAIHSMVGKELAHLLRDRPGVFESEQLTQLAHAHAGLTQLPVISIESERMSFLDTLQRAYSDNGHGDGRMTPEAFEYYGLMTAPPDDFGPVSVADAISIDPRMRAATMPLSIVLSNSREQERALHGAVMDQAQLVLDRGVQWVSVMRDAELIVEKVRAEETPMRISFAAMMTPGMSQVVHRWYRYEHTMGAISLMLAIEAYRDEHGRLPDSLSMLQARYLPEIPLDLMDPGSSIKYLVEGDRYVLYSVGSDGDDDDARAPEKPVDPYLRNQETSFDLRYPQARSPMTNKPIFESGGKPMLAEPTGPDGDWILIDTRPVPDSDAEAS